MHRLARALLSSQDSCGHFFAPALGPFVPTLVLCPILFAFGFCHITHSTASMSAATPELLVVEPIDTGPLADNMPILFAELPVDAGSEENESEALVSAIHDLVTNDTISTGAEGDGVVGTAGNEEITASAEDAEDVNGNANAGNDDTDDAAVEARNAEASNTQHSGEAANVAEDAEEAEDAGTGDISEAPADEKDAAAAQPGDAEDTAEAAQGSSGSLSPAESTHKAAPPKPTKPNSRRRTARRKTTATEEPEEPTEPEDAERFTETKEKSSDRGRGRGRGRGKAVKREPEAPAELEPEEEPEPKTGSERRTRETRSRSARHSKSYKEVESEDDQEDEEDEGAEEDGEGEEENGHEDIKATPVAEANASEDEGEGEGEGEGESPSEEAVEPVKRPRAARSRKKALSDLADARRQRGRAVKREPQGSAELDQMEQPDSDGAKGRSRETRSHSSRKRKSYKEVESEGDDDEWDQEAEGRDGVAEEEEEGVTKQATPISKDGDSGEPPSDEDVKPAKRARGARFRKPPQSDLAVDKPDVDGASEHKPAISDNDTKRKRRRRTEPKEEPQSDPEDVKPDLEDVKPDLKDAKPDPEDDEEGHRPAKRARKAKSTKPNPRVPTRWTPEDRKEVYLAAIQANCGGDVKGERFAAGIAGRNAKQCLDNWQKTVHPFILKYLSEEAKPVPKDYIAEPSGRQGKGWDGAALQALFNAAVGTETPRFTQGVRGRTKPATRDTWR